MSVLHTQRHAHACTSKNTHTYSRSYLDTHSHSQTAHTDTYSQMAHTDTKILRQKHTDIYRHTVTDGRTNETPTLTRLPHGTRSNGNLQIANTKSSHFKIFYVGNNKNQPITDRITT